MEVLTCARDTSELEELAAARGEGEAGLHVIAADVGTQEGRTALLEYIEAKLGGKLDYLVNNVGTNIRKVLGARCSVLGARCSVVCLIIERTNQPNDSTTKRLQDCTAKRSRNHITTRPQGE